jgi:hypothetical protein
MHKLKDHILEISSHAALCTEAHIKALLNDNAIVLESKKMNGFNTNITCKCQGCGKTFELENSELRLEKALSQT